MDEINLKPVDLPGGIFCLDEELQISCWNSEMERITGWPPGEVLGKSVDFIELFTAEQKPVDFLGCLQEKNAGSRHVLLKTRDDARKSVFIQAKILKDHTEKTPYAIFQVSDVTHIISCEQRQMSEDDDTHFHNLVGRDSKMRELYKMIRLAAESMSNIFVNGESGTGKELVAKAIHALSARNEGPFIVVNCSALSENLLESELFGHVKGAFTGAVQSKPGKFEAAHNGTIFLDEIGDISPAIQLKLLRVIQEKKIMRVGANEERKVDMRIITATNRDLRQLVDSGEFREDLYYRLKVFTIRTIPLREKPVDIPLLCHYFINHFNRRTGKRIVDLTNDAYRIMLEYCWPGNVRELENAIEHAFVLCEGEYIEVFDLPVEMRTYHLRDRYCKNFAQAPEATSRPAGREELVKALQRNDWNRTRTAAELGISRVALWKRMKKWEINDL